MRMSSRLLILIVDIIAAFSVGTYFFRISLWQYPLQIIFGIICIAAGVASIVSYLLHRSGRTGTFHSLVTAITVICNLPVVFYAITLGYGYLYIVLDRLFCSRPGAAMEPFPHRVLISLPVRCRIERSRKLSFAASSVLAFCYFPGPSPDKYRRHR